MLDTVGRSFAPFLDTEEHYMLDTVDRLSAPFLDTAEYHILDTVERSHAEPQLKKKLSSNSKFSGPQLFKMTTKTRKFSDLRNGTFISPLN